MRVLENIVKSVEKNRADLAHRVDQLRYSREERSPTPEFVVQLQNLIEEELRLVESDEMVILNRKKDRHAPDEIHVNAVSTQGQPPKGGAQH